MAPMASLQVSKVKCNFSEPTETRCPLVWCNPTIKAYGYEHPIAKTPTEDMDSGVSSKGADKDFDFSSLIQHLQVKNKLSGLLGPQVALLVSVRLLKMPRRISGMKEVIDHEDQSQGTRSPSAGPSSPDRLSPGLGLVPWTFDHPSEDVLEFENYKERARRLLVNTHRLLGAHVGKMVKGPSNHRYSEFVQRGWEMDGLLTHAITQLSDWYETLEVENYEGFEWDDSHSKRKAEDSP
ncbi:hypothetical protein PPACK8108_LOCUS5151 [Phakopsora pachyrhizi]|uniref:Uncharacterized protein n=1 Tax=Phakopsora pachyrhizi TaxID=170000 RepID=A0AAV0AQ33_PHAPC|nr:hypothetical protein PPACK8108_LOCUS5151 [Phakopsora pachyrhizi]